MKWLVVLGGAGFAVVAASQFLRDTKDAVRGIGRPKPPWEQV